MLLKEGEITIASGFMAVVLILAQEMVANHLEMVVQVVVCILICINVNHFLLVVLLIRDDCIYFFLKLCFH